MHKRPLNISEVILKYTLDTSDDIALNCDHWTATDFAGAIDSGLLQYEGWEPKNESGAPFIPVDGAVTVLISVRIETYNPVLEEVDFTYGIVDAFQNGACRIEANDTHTVTISIKGIIHDHNIHHPE
ncbi:hypothetical protein AAEO56_12255 [Flavobacterium sp. DGU11]|uniref:Uncharacterized protein n=1 Tax=Flavobacterium arundinis TaxID=3139143 RepID=A0ABU9HXZ9_9FLAO